MTLAPGTKLGPYEILVPNRFGRDGVLQHTFRLPGTIHFSYSRRVNILRRRSIAHLSTSWNWYSGTYLADLRQSELEISESGALTIRLALDSGRLVQDGYIRLSAAEGDRSTKFTLHFGSSTAAIHRAAPDT
jgi:hypothetical protein